ncbi:hypothetical protein E6H22_00440 [Candidatus Bathyarchaeota archaeon]|nr:MAG: hypothetical protein E6H22_00440 [Candidatus Bathyarchaeota archaeon]
MNPLQVERSFKSYGPNHLSREKGEAVCRVLAEDPSF